MRKPCHTGNADLRLFALTLREFEITRC